MQLEWSIGTIGDDTTQSWAIFRAIVDIAVYSKQRRIERIVKDDESSIRSDTRD